VIEAELLEVIWAWYVAVAVVGFPIEPGIVFGLVHECCRWTTCWWNELHRNEEDNTANKEDAAARGTVLAGLSSAIQ
jgi:hypothetical protein